MATTVYLYPNGNINTPMENVGADGYLAIDDPYDSPDDASTYLKAIAYSNEWNYQSFTFDNLPSEVGTITSVTVYIRSRCLIFGSYVQGWRAGFNLWKDSSPSSWERSIDESSGGTSWLTLSKTYTTNPFTGNAFTKSEVDALCGEAFGISLGDSDDYNRTDLTQVYLKVEYKEKPTVTTDASPSAKDHESATLGGEVTDADGQEITERGFEYEKITEGSEVDQTSSDGQKKLYVTATGNFSVGDKIVINLLMIWNMNTLLAMLMMLRYAVIPRRNQKKMMILGKKRLI